MTLSSVPEHYLTQLNDLAVLQIHGEEATKYLQGQVTNDVNKLTQHNAQTGCHCDLKGKCWNIFTALNNGDSFFLIGDQGGMQTSLAELKKYAVFSKVEISDVSQQWQVLGGFGQQLVDALHNTLPTLPNKHMQVVWQDDLAVVFLSAPQPRYLILTTAQQADNLAPQRDPTALWNSLDILAGMANIQAATSNEFVPQMLNMQAVNAISFNKGCYVGQEVVARTKYLGKNKRAAFILTADGSNTLAAGDLLEKQLGDNWRRGGTVIRASEYRGSSQILAILANDTEVGDILRSKVNPEQVFTVQPLPYSLEN